MATIQSFEEIEAWQKVRELTRAVFACSGAGAFAKDFALRDQIRRAAKRFPADFMFVFTREELADWRSQSVTSNSDRMGLRHAPMAFTEQGVAMLSSVLNSERAIQVNIAIMRTFTQLRQMLASHADLAQKLADLEKRYDAQFRVVFDAIRQLMKPPDPQHKRIGFHMREPLARYSIRRKRE